MASSSIQGNHGKTEKHGSHVKKQTDPKLESLSPRLERSDIIIAHYSVEFLGSNGPPAFASEGAETKGIYQHHRTLLESEREAEA
ncbi:protein PPP5D1-like isoform X2 [Chlorocebus sabaeus]|uniref:protein PPP5D1-like isoform X2 n=1 Tax=Chlorocebus sabaeus TaxID=60711 RepID=UPI003BF9A67C